MLSLASKTTLSSILALFLTGVALAAGVRERVLSYSTHDGLEIECILSLPDPGDGPFPGMLLISGSGLHDADVSLNVSTLEITHGPQSLFKPMARYFSRQGWAVQRCNKRGASFGHAADNPQVLESSALDDLVEDARGALDLLHDHPQVMASPLVVLGHSEGASIATRLAMDNPDIDLLVLLGSVARRFDSLLEYQLVDRNLTFLTEAADANRDGSLTLEELDLLDGNLGRGSVYVLNSAPILFQTTGSEKGRPEIRGLNTKTDLDGDGRLHIVAEIEPALRQEARRFIELAREGSLGLYWQSLVDSAAPSSEISRVDSQILFVHGALDVQAPIDEPLALMAVLESGQRSNYDLLVFPNLGHSLSKPNDFYLRDGGLTILDNLTLNSPRPSTRRRLLRRIEKNLGR